MPHYLVPSYYPDFLCKGGACRHTCCSDWHISLSWKESLRLRGMECSEELAARIREGLIEYDEPTEEHYAYFRMKDGCCPLLREDGLCALQKECGAEALSSVCDLFPRSVRADYARECVCSASCEKVLELLFAMDKPMRIIKKTLHYETDVILPEDTDPRAHEFLNSLRTLCWSTLHDGDSPASARVETLMRSLWQLHLLQEEHDIEDVVDALRSGVRVTMPDLPAGGWVDLGPALALCGAFMPKSASVTHMWKPLTEALGLPEGRTAWEVADYERAADRYAALRDGFERLYPRHDFYFRQLLLNHAYFTRMPCSDRLTSLRDEALALCAFYVISRFVCVCLARDGSVETLIDTLTHLMRVTEHGNLDRESVHILASGALCDLDLLSACIRAV